MKVGDLVRDITPGSSYGIIGLVMEEEEYDGETGTWVEYFEDDYAAFEGSQLRWYSFDERYTVEVLSDESR